MSRMCIVAPQYFREDDYDLNFLWEVTKTLESKLPGCVTYSKSWCSVRDYKNWAKVHESS